MCEKRRFAVQTVYLPGILNVVADRQFGWKPETSEWRLLNWPELF